MRSITKIFFLGPHVHFSMELSLPAAEDLVGCLKVGRGGTTILAIPEQCSGHFHRILWLQDFAWHVYATVNLLQVWWHRDRQFVSVQDRAVSCWIPRLILADHMMQYIGFSLGLCGPGLLSTSPERSSMFELSQLTATKLPSATIIASKLVDGWITADWSQLFLRREPTTCVWVQLLESETHWRKTPTKLNLPLN